MTRLNNTGSPSWSADTRADGEYTFDKLSSVVASGATRDDHIRIQERVAL